MTSSEIRKKYLEFFEKRGHKIIPSSSLIPEKDATTLFTGSGMQPLLPYLLGESHPGGKRLVNSQKCFRAEDIEEVGDNRHTTFFEMLGNWSLGDYFKAEQLPWFFEFLTDEVGLDPKRLYVTVFAGDKKNGIPKDEESSAIWKKLFQEKGIEVKEVELVTLARGGEFGMQGGRIFYYDAKKNWWSRTGAPEKMPANEPGGPDSEVFYDFHPELGEKCLMSGFGTFCHPNCDCGRFMEIGNSVFMEYLKKEDGSFEKLKQRNVDFGGGLERITAALGNDSDIFQIDIFKPLILELVSLSGKRYEDSAHQKSFRVIADHVRAATFMLADGVLPSHNDRGYILRRLIRRALRHLNRIEVSGEHLEILSKSVIKIYADQYPGLARSENGILSALREEEARFKKTLASGLRYVHGMTELQNISGKIISGADAFILFSTYGFPIEMTEEIAKEKGMTVDIKGFKSEMEKHQDISRAGAEKKFGGHGLYLKTGEVTIRDQSEVEKVTRLHTATHLLHQALRQTLGPEVRQNGSDITVERTRFDFNFPRKLTPEEVKSVEKLVNEKIKEDLPVSFVELPKAEAEKTGALFFFTAKYGDTVKVYYIGKDLNSAWSKEFCGGPHVAHTAEIGAFKISKEEAVASGLRRIRGIVEP
ncbi:MAG: alanine--tRNA ligase [Candidatus Liptonbacteria bacterium]|nr:alanine--tRNA ligase [Candidatus Liptonbacteria bacterium]